MEKLAESAAFKAMQNIVLEGFDPVSAGGFTQVPNILLRDPTISSNAKVAYAELLSYAWHNNFVFPGQERMASDTGMSKSTVSRATSELEDSGWLEVRRRGQGKTNMYILKFTVRKKGRS
jgi:DNA-binding transcriptional ArsR family regulator